MAIFTTKISSMTLRHISIIEVVRSPTEKELAIQLQGMRVTNSLLLLPPSEHTSAFKLRPHPSQAISMTE